VSVGQSLIIELEEAIKADRKTSASMRCGITDLFVAGTDRLTDQQIDVFDDILGHLIKDQIEGARRRLSRRLAPIHNAPIEVVRRLARDDDIVVAEPF
jgi:uncharacterized protein (DUF2336 family)